MQFLKLRRFPTMSGPVFGLDIWIKVFFGIFIVLQNVWSISKKLQDIQYTKHTFMIFNSVNYIDIKYAPDSNETIFPEKFAFHLNLEHIFFELSTHGEQGWVQLLCTVFGVEFFKWSTFFFLKPTSNPNFFTDLRSRLNFLQES